MGEAARSAEGGRPHQPSPLATAAYLVHLCVVARPDHTDLSQLRGRMLRRSLTISEARVWSAIKNKALGVRFRRQVPIGPWIVDFACLDPKLVVEIDDESHLHRAETGRTRYLERMGFTVLRFWNVDVAKELEGVVGTIENWVEALRAGLDPEV